MGIGRSIKKAGKKFEDKARGGIKDLGESVGLESGSDALKAVATGGTSLLFEGSSSAAGSALVGVGKHVIDPLLGSPVAKGEARAAELEAQAKATADKQRRDRIGLAASQALAIEEGIASKKRNKVGSASAILTGQSGPAIVR